MPFYKCSTKRGVFIEQLPIRYYKYYTICSLCAVVCIEILMTKWILKMGFNA